eukprot:TRINITY_DN74719_c0_g1_i1.p1 TRINITY_DN74719_c0_g1~~TRINITY_DN74719_c0_g1_i1.p1  ORF type:complete len:166 (+),score=10.74 TRINITY_DN74719_c0_g1_i1:287-784(+)
MVPIAQWVTSLYLLLALAACGIKSDLIDKILRSNTWNIKTCGLPQIEASHMSNLTVKPGEKVVFNCKVDLSCMVSTIRWYHEMENGTEVLIKTPSDPGIPYVHEIRSVATTDQGMYTCVARNVVGRAHAAAYLAVDRGSMLNLDVRLVLVLLVANISFAFRSGLS